MSGHEIVLGAKSLQVLAELIGRLWQCFGASSMGPRLFATFEAFVVTDGPAITLSSTVDYWNIDDDPFDTPIAELSVDRGAAQLREATEMGCLYYFHSGSTVLDVLVVRDTLSEIHDGQSRWRLVKDVGIVFVLTTGVIAISQDILHDEMLVFTVADSMEHLDLPHIQRKWKTRVGFEYQASRDCVSVRHLPNA